MLAFILEILFFLEKIDHLGLGSILHEWMITELVKRGFVTFSQFKISWEIVHFGFPLILSFRQSIAYWEQRFVRLFSPRILNMCVWVKSFKWRHQSSK